jgi:hypothetical protein
LKQIRKRHRARVSRQIRSSSAWTETFVFMYPPLLLRILQCRNIMIWVKQKISV